MIAIRCEQTGHGVGPHLLAAVLGGAAGGLAPTRTSGTGGTTHTGPRRAHTALARHAHLPASNLCGR
jgi:hypothetical protein